MHKNFTYISLFLVLIAVFGCSQINGEDTNKTTGRKLTYDANGGIGNMESTTGDEGSEITLAANTFIKNGYTFAGWNTKADGKGEKYANKETIKLTTDMTLYAQWIVIEYKITYELNGGTNISDNPVSYTIETETITLKAPTEHGFTFLGWYKDSKFAERSKVTEIVKGSIGNIVLYAKWDFVKIPGVSITGNETWNPISAVFIERRKFDIAAFWMSNHEVTRAEYKEIMGNDPSTAKAYDKAGNELKGIEVNNNPVTNVSWYDAIVYCNKRSINEGLTPCYSVYGYIDPTSVKFVVPDTTNDKIWDAVECDFKANGYRLPTEAEWEWAARGGENYKYAGSDNLDEVAWNADNTESSGTREVRSKKANDYGLYDMSGNVFEWCWDWHENSILTDTPDTGTLNNSGYRCIRGGSSYSGDNYCGVSYRMLCQPFKRGYFIGLRVVRTAE